jgi:hypothetical protein
MPAHTPAVRVSEALLHYHRTLTKGWVQLVYLLSGTKEDR